MIPYSPQKLRDESEQILHVLEEKCRRVIKDVNSLLDVNKFLEDYKHQYDNDDIKGCEVCILLLAIV